MTEKDSGSDSEHPTSPVSSPAPRSFPIGKRLTSNPTLVASLLISIVITGVFLAVGGSSKLGQKKTNDPAGTSGKFSTPVLNAAIRSKKSQPSGGKAVEPVADSDDVKPKQPYRPRLKGWSKKLLRGPQPVAEGSEPSDTSCVAWRQTSRCDPNGPREPFFDVFCNITITSNKGSGYCDCGSKGRKAEFGCGFHRDFLCSDVCDIEGYFEKLMDGANLEPDRGDGNGGEADGGGFGDDAVVDDIKLGQQGYEPAKAKVSPTPTDPFAGLYLSPELRRALESRQPDPSYCVGWRQTSGCTPTGALDPSFDRPCTLPILNGMSGYCECKGRSKGKGPGVHCQHRPFRCVEQCDPAFKLESVLHPLALSSLEDHDTGDKTFPVVTKFDYRNSNDPINDGTSGGVVDRFYQRETVSEQQLLEPTRLKKLAVEMRHLIDVSLFKRAMTSWFLGIGGSIDDELMEQIGLDEAAHKQDPAGLSWWTGLHSPQLTAFDADLKAQIEKAKDREQEREKEREKAHQERDRERPSLKDTEPGKAVALREMGQLNHQRNLQSSLVERMEAQKAERLLDEQLSEVEPVDKGALRIAEKVPQSERIEHLRQEEAKLRAQDVVGEFQRHQLHPAGGENRNRYESPVDLIPGEGTPGFVPEAEQGLKHHRQVRSQEAAQLLERYQEEAQLRRHQR